MSGALGALPRIRWLLNFGRTRSPCGSRHEIGDILATVAGKPRRNASANPIWASFLPASLALLIPAVVRIIVIT